MAVFGKNLNSQPLIKPAQQHTRDAEQKVQELSQQN